MAVLVVGLVACVTDLRSRRIPNVLTFGASGAALVFWTWTAGLSGLGLEPGGWMVGCALFLPWFVLGGMGAGDVKLLAALGAWLGPRDALWLALFAAWPAACSRWSCRCRPGIFASRSAICGDC